MALDLVFINYFSAFHLLSFNITINSFGAKTLTPNPRVILATALSFVTTTLSFEPDDRTDIFL